MITDPRVFQDEYLPRELKHREGPVEELCRAFDPAVDGDQATDVLVAGPSGVGKTVLVRHTLGRLEQYADVDVEFNVEVSAKYEGVEELANRLEEGKPLLARNLYKVPMVGDVPVDPEKVDVVRIQPESAQIRPEREKAIVDAILQEHLGIDAEIEVVGIVDTDDLPGYGEDYEEPTGAVDREDYRGGTADDPGS